MYIIKSIFGDEIIAAFNKDADYQAFFNEIFVDFKNNKTILGDDIVAHIKDPDYQAFLKQIVVEYTEEKIDKKTMITKQTFTFKNKNTQKILAQAYDYKNYEQRYKIYKPGWGIFQCWRTLDAMCEDGSVGGGIGEACDCKIGEFKKRLSPKLLQFIEKKCENMSADKKYKDGFCLCLESYKNNSVVPAFGGSTESIGSIME